MRSSVSKSFWRSLVAPDIGTAVSVPLLAPLEVPLEVPLVSPLAVPLVLICLMAMFILSSVVDLISGFSSGSIGKEAPLYTLSARSLGYFHTLPHVRTIIQEFPLWH